jgi:hypothetical protein
MVKYYFFLFIFLVPSILHAQDLIIKKDGERIQCKITSEDSSKINYDILVDSRRYHSFIFKDEVSGYYYNFHVLINEINDSLNRNNFYRNCATIGILQGGGSLIGVDVEFYLGSRIGIQAGAGIIGFGGGINLHLKPRVKSSFVSLQYWHQGVNVTYTQSLVGPSFVFRGKKWLTAQLGLGFALEKGPAWPSSINQSPVMLMYAIGGYIPW